MEEKLEEDKLEEGNFEQAQVRRREVRRRGRQPRKGIFPAFQGFNPKMVSKRARSLGVCIYFNCRDTNLYLAMKVASRMVNFGPSWTARNT